MITNLIQAQIAAGRAVQNWMRGAKPIPMRGDSRSGMSLMGPGISKPRVSPAPPASMDFDRATSRGTVAPRRATPEPGAHSQTRITYNNPESNYKSEARSAFGNAGLPVPEKFWDTNPTMKSAADARAQAMTDARKEAGGPFILSGDQLPAVADPTKAEYFQSADMAAWAKANPTLAARLPGFKAAMSAQPVQGIGPVADGDQYAKNLQALQGTTGIGPVADGDTYGQMIAPAPPRDAGMGDFSTRGLAAASAAVNAVAPGAGMDATAFQGVATTPELTRLQAQPSEADDLIKNEYRRRLSGGFEAGQPMTYVFS